MKKILIPLLLAASLMAGCENLTTNGKPPVSEPTYDQAAMSQFIKANYTAAEELMKSYGSPTSANNFSNAGAPFIVSTLVNIDRLEQSSTLGRLISEQLTSRFSQLGKNVVELKVRNSVFMKQNEGEFLLTREIKEMASAHKAQAIVVGTYADGGDFVFVSLKLINPSNSLILSSYDYALPMNRQVRRLSNSNKQF